MNKFKQSHGFSVIEVLVVITIIVVLSSILIANYNTFGKKSAAITAAQNMASNIRKAQSYSLSGRNTEASFGDNLGYWGVYFSNIASTSYSIYADINRNKNYDIGESYTTIDLPRDVTVSGFLNGGTSTSIVYIPPEPKIVLINNPLGATSTEEIILRNKSGYEKRVKINNFGLVDVND